MKIHHLLVAGALLYFGCSESMTTAHPWNLPKEIQEGDLAAETVGVDHFQFYLRDASIAPTEGIVTDFPQIGPTFGADATMQDQFFLISTVKEAGDIRVRLVVSNAAPSIADYQFVGCIRFRVASGAIAVDGYYSEAAISAKLPEGDYSCYICSPNGMDYEIFFVPNEAPKFGDLTPRKTGTNKT